MVAVADEISQRTLQLFQESEALLDGHFLLSSGRHAGRYVQCAKLLQFPELAGTVCADLAAQFEGQVDVVLGPAMGAVTLAYELGRAAKVRALFAERDPEGGFLLRRGFSIEPGERVLVAEDVITTGGSVREVLHLLEELRARPVGVAALINRSGEEKPFNELPFYRLVDLDVPSYAAEDCPLCANGGEPPVKPGSRPGA